MLQKAREQHKPLIDGLQSRSLKGAQRNNRVNLHVILLGVAGIVYNHTITPLANLGIPKHKAHKLATQLRLHAVESLTHHKASTHSRSLVLCHLFWRQLSVLFNPSSFPGANSARPHSLWFWVAQLQSNNERAVHGEHVCKHKEWRRLQNLSTGSGSSKNSKYPA